MQKVIHTKYKPIGGQMILGGLAGVTGLAAAVLGAVPANVSATTATADASVTVQSACTMTRGDNGTGTYSVTLQNGTYQLDIGSTKLTTICNDASGFAIYAVGYSEDTYGNTSMVGASSGLTIPTGTAVTDVSSSKWAMKLSKDTSSYTPANLSIVNSFDSYAAVPQTYTKVANYSASTDTTTGSSVLANYAVAVASDQAADTYTGQVRYTMVHPSSAAAPQGL